MATILENSIKSLKKCYVGIGEDGKHTLDKTKIDDLEFLFAITQVSMAIKKGEMTDAQFISKVSESSEPNFSEITPMDKHLIALSKKNKCKRTWYGRKK